MQLVAPEEYKALTLATYLRISNEKGFTRKTAAFILNLALTTLNDRYKHYIERNQGISYFICGWVQIIINIYALKLFLKINAAENVTVTKRGRLAICDEEGKLDAVLAANTRCLEGHGFAMVGDFQRFMEPYTRGL
jgi:hypothetical protein